MASNAAYVGAGAVALAGAAVLGYQIYSSGRPATPVSPADRVIQDLGEAAGPAGGGEPGETAPPLVESPPLDSGHTRREIIGGGGGQAGPVEWVESAIADTKTEFAFADAATPEEAAVHIDESSRLVSTAIDRSESLAGSTARKKQSLAEAWRSLARPIIADDRDGFVAAAHELGVVSPEGDPDRAAANLYERLRTLLGGASLDLSAVRVTEASATDPRRAPVLPKGIDLPEGALPVMVNQNAFEDGPSITSMQLPLIALFPAGGGAEKLTEVWVPAREPGKDSRTADLGLSLFFAWDSGSQRWIPAGVRVVGLTDASGEKIESSLHGAG